MTLHIFNFPTTIHFGFGATLLLAGKVQEQKYRRPLIVTDAGVARQPFFETILSGLKKEKIGFSIYSGVHPNPIESDVVNGAAACREFKADSLIAIGGGSSLDAAKAIAFTAIGGGSPFDYASGQKNIPENILPIIAIPTTAGTGSEVGRSTVISEDKTGIKHVIFSPVLLPKLVLADPEATISLPPKITAATGMDAMTHNVEAYIARDFHPICDGIALEGTRLVVQNLERAVLEGTNRVARKNMLLAAMMGAIAFQKGLGACHSMAHSLTTVAGVPHGMANALCLPIVLEFNKKVVSDRLVTLATHSGIEDQTADGFIRFIKNLTHSTGIPKRLREAGIQEEMLPRLVEFAVKDGCHQENPRPVTKSDFERMYGEIF